MITLYQLHESGNCYKVRLLLWHLSKSFQMVTVNSRDGSTRTPAFLAKNPIGKVPAVQLDDGRYLGESNAILLHFAETTAYLPADAYDRAKTYEWLFFEQYVHEPAIAVRRVLITYPERRAQATPDRMAQLLDAGNRALAVMETRLEASDWLAGQAFSIADMALYAYTHTAEEGGYDLSAYPGIQHWLDRVAAVPGHRTLAAVD